MKFIEIVKELSWEEYPKDISKDMDMTGQRTNAGSIDLKCEYCSRETYHGYSVKVEWPYSYGAIVRDPRLKNNSWINTHALRLCNKECLQLYLFSKGAL